MSYTFFQSKINKFKQAYKNNARIVKLNVLAGGFFGLSFGSLTGAVVEKAFFCQDKVDYINIHAADYNCTTLPHFHCPANLNNLFIDCNNTQTLINQANNNTSYSWSPTLVGGAIGCGFGALVGFGVGVATACSRMRSSASSLTESEIPTTTSDRSSTSAIDTATKDDIKLLAQGRSNSPVFSGRNIENDDSYHKLPESESEHTVALTV